MSLMRRSTTYIVRTWFEKLGDDQMEVRGMVRNVQSGETKYFRHWDALVAFVREHSHASLDKLLGESSNDPPNDPSDDAERRPCSSDNVT